MLDASDVWHAKQILPHYNRIFLQQDRRLLDFHFYNVAELLGMTHEAYLHGYDLTNVANKKKTYMAF